MTSQTKNLNLESLRDLCFCYPAPYCYQSVTLRQNVSEATLWIKYETFWKHWLFFHSCQLLYRDHERFGKSITRFSKTFVKTQIILRVNRHFWGKIFMSILFSDIMFIVLKYKAIKCRECEQLLSIQRKNTSKI